MFISLILSMFLADLPKAEDWETYVEQSKAWRVHHHKMTHDGNWREEARKTKAVSTKEGEKVDAKDYEKKFGTKFPASHPFGKQIKDGTRVDLWRGNDGTWFGTIKAEQRYYYRGPNHIHWTDRRHTEAYGHIYFCPATKHWYYWCVPDASYYPIDYCPYGNYKWQAEDEVDLTPDGKLKAKVTSEGK